MKDYCSPDSITITAFSPTAITYEVSEPSLVSTFTQWITDPDPCYITLEMTVSPSLPDPNMIVFDATAMTITVYTATVWYGGEYLTGIYVSGTYIVEIRAWAEEGAIDTGVTSNLIVKVNNPCIDPFFTWIDVPVTPLTV